MAIIGDGLHVPTLPAEGYARQPFRDNAGRRLASVDQVSRVLGDHPVDGWNTGSHLASAGSRAGLDLARLDEEQPRTPSYQTSALRTWFVVRLELMLRLAAILSPSTINRGLYWQFVNAKSGRVLITRTLSLRTKLAACGVSRVPRPWQNPCGRYRQKSLMRWVVRCRSTLMVRLRQQRADC